MPETLSEEEMFNLTPSLKQRLREFAAERRWPIAATIRYFIEVGLEDETRRAELAPFTPTRS
jgi:hypothetical protein